MKWALAIIVIVAVAGVTIWILNRDDGPYHTLRVDQSYREAELTALRAGYYPYPDPRAVPSTPEGFAVTLHDGRQVIVYRDPKADRVISMQVRLPAVLKEGEWVYRTVTSFDLPDHTGSTGPGGGRSR